MTYFKQIKLLMDNKKLDGVLLTGGGIIPDSDMEELEKMGLENFLVQGQT